MELLWSIGMAAFLVWILRASYNETEQNRRTAELDRRAFWGDLQDAIDEDLSRKRV